jgi:hypothetical protein
MHWKELNVSNIFLIISTFYTKKKIVVIYYLYIQRYAKRISKGVYCFKHSLVNQGP